MLHRVGFPFSVLSDRFGCHPKDRVGITGEELALILEDPSYLLSVYMDDDKCVGRPTPGSNGSPSKRNSKKETKRNPKENDWEENKNRSSIKPGYCGQKEESE